MHAIRVERPAKDSFARASPLCHNKGPAAIATGRLQGSARCQGVPPQYVQGFLRSTASEAGVYLGLWRPGQDDDCSADPSPRLPQATPRGALQRTTLVMSRCQEAVLLCLSSGAAHNSIVCNKVPQQCEQFSRACSAVVRSTSGASILGTLTHLNVRCDTQPQKSQGQASIRYVRDGGGTILTQSLSCISRVPTWAARDWRCPGASNRRQGRAAAKTPIAAPPLPQSARPPAAACSCPAAPCPIGQGRTVDNHCACLHN